MLIIYITSHFYDMSYEYYYDIKSLIDDARWLCFFGMGGSTPLTSGDKEFAAGLLKVLDMERAPNISSRRKAIPQYIINLYKRKFSRTASKIDSTTWIFFPQGNAAAQGFNS